MIYLIPNFLLIFVQSDNDAFIKELIKRWKEDNKLYRYDLLGGGKNLIKKLINFIKNFILIYKILKNDNYQIIFFEWGSDLFRRVTRLFKFKKPVVVRIHRYELYKKTINKVNFDKIDKIILVSEYMKTEFLKKFPNLQNKIVVIHNAINLNEYYPDPTKKTSYKICTLSYLIKRKRIDLVINSMKYVRNKKIKLYIGGKGALESQLKNKIKQENLENRVFLEGRIKILRDWFKDKDFIINSSDNESFGVSLIEAMACGVIPLVRGWDAARALYPHDYILPFDEKQFVKSLAQRLDECYELKEEIQNSKRNLIRDFVKDRYSINKQIQKFNNLFSSLTK